MPGTRFFWNSIRWRAALLTSALVAAVLTTFIWFTVARVEADLLTSGLERAEAASTLLAAQTAQSSQQGLTRIDEVARDAAVRACFVSPGDKMRSEAIAAIRRASGPGPDETIELWDTRGRLILHAAFPPQAAEVMPPEPAPTGTGLLPLRTRGDVLFARTVAGVPADPSARSGARLGYLIISRVVRASASSAVVNGVVGNGATVLVGNQSGSVWTDLGRIVPAPVIDLSKAGAREFHNADGEAEIGAPANIAGTPWVLLIEFPRSVILAPASRLLKRLIAAGAAFLLLAMLAATALSGRVTKPLGELTRAAQAIEGGDYSRRIVAPRRDEVGQLGHAFNAMAEQVETGHVALETRAAELVVSREEARHANQVKDEFLAVLSHELRTPLNAMLGWCQMLREGAVPRDGWTHALEVVERNAIAQLRLVEDLLDVSRIVAGKFAMEMQRVNPAAVVHAAVESIQPMAASKDIAVSVDLGQETASGRGYVHGDAGRLQQVVWNLLSNAIKFTPRGGTVSVAVAHLESSVEIVVRDTGEGISREALPLIFDRLQQGESGMARRSTGLGLGLAIVRQVVDLHLGTVSAESPGRGHGATFRIVLPMSLASETASASVPAPVVIAGVPADAGAPSVSGLRVLVVEDADDAREMLNKLLTREGAIVTAVPGAESAVGWLQRNRPDVIISDIEMAGQNGFEMMRAIRSWPVARERFIPAIALTADAAPEDRERSLASGFQVHLLKPVNLTELLRTMASLVGSPGEPRGTARC